MMTASKHPLYTLCTKNSV